MQRQLPLLGAHPHPGPTTRFSLFSSEAQRCEVRLYRDADTALRTLPLDALGPGYFEALAEDVGHGALYKFVLDGRELPDPYARYLPFGVHGPGMVIEPRYTFRHPRPERPQRPVIYELHVGTFTEAGSYAAAVLRLPELAQLGVTTLELLPVAAFPGERGWGYDGVTPFAPFAGYGTPDELRALVDAAHGLGLSVLLDVVYNHFGPAGNYLGAYSADYFAKGVNAWGDGPNYRFLPMRELVRENVRYWLEEFRFDGLRFDAVHAIVDPSERHIIHEAIAMARHVVPSAYLIAEDDRNDPALVRDQGFDGIWADDFHHQLHVTLTGERDGYYAAYQPGVEGLARCIERGWLYEGQTFAPGGKARGKPAGDLPAGALVYCLQNHDQVGNRALGDRLSQALDPNAYALASSLLLFLPMTPLLFMGQEWASSTPFQFFTDHEPALGARVSEGRRAEFKGFRAFDDESARAAIPDPQARSTFESSKLRWDERSEPRHAEVLALYTQLLALRRDDPVLGAGGREALAARARGDVLEVRRAAGNEQRVWFGNFGARSQRLELPHAARVLSGRLEQDGSLGPHQFVILAL
ncbi:MAG TPA: malto-oligosyltrehalose trehalohydrolase [Polyangiales bacterium]